MTRVAVPVAYRTGNETPRGTAAGRGAADVVRTGVTTRLVVDGAGRDATVELGRAIVVVLAARLVVGVTTALLATRTGRGAPTVCTALGSTANVGLAVCTDGRLDDADGSATSAAGPEDAWLIPIATVAQPATASEAARPPTTRPSDMRPVWQV